MLFAVLLVVTTIANIGDCKQPHILLIVADDLGFNDIGYHGSDILTPNLNLLAYNGVRLENYYVQPMSFPTRSQLMSGKYQIHTGLQHGDLSPAQKNALPLGTPTLAETIKKAGYATHMVGKWHLGMFKEDYLPTKRGFDSFYGFLNGWEDHYTRFRCDTEMCGFDFRNDMEPVTVSSDMYSANLFSQKAVEIIEKHPKDKPLFMYVALHSPHSPLQAPQEYSQNYADESVYSRRIFSGAVAAMDEAVHNITNAFKAGGLWNDTILVFTTDNGGDPYSGGSNAPLRGGKSTLWEGGVRGVGFVNSQLLSSKVMGTVCNELIHVSDWYPTLVRVAGGEVNGVNLDGIDQWNTLSQGKSGPRKEILHNIDPLQEPVGNRLNYTDFDNRVRAAIRVGDYKLITGDPGRKITTRHPTLENNANIPIRSTKNVWLYNIESDPDEGYDLSVLPEYQPILKGMLKKLVEYNMTAITCNFPSADKNADPALHNLFWGPWVKV